MIIANLLLIKVAAADAALSDSHLQIDPAKTSYDLSLNLSYLEDKSGSLAFAQIRSPETDSQWQLNTKGTVNFGYTNSVYWFSIELINPYDRAISRLIEIDYPVLDYIDFYTIEPDGDVNLLQMGDKRPFSERPMNHRNFIIPIGIDSDSSLQIYMRVQTNSSMQIPMILWQRDAFLSYSQNESVTMGFFIGVMLIMALYNLFVYISVLENNYLFYVFFVVSMILFLGGIKGINFQYLWPYSTQWNDQSIIVGLAGAILFGALFARDFTSLRGNRPLLDYFMIFLVIVNTGIILFSFVLSYTIMIHAVIITAVFAIIGAMAVGIIRMMDGDIPAKYFMLAWTAMMFGGIILAANKFNLISRNIFTENATVYGMALQVLLLSFALAERLNREKKASFMAQMEALKQERIARKAREKALEIQKRTTEILERRVKERTVELEQANKKLAALSITDGLTGIKNRRYFNRVYPYEFKRAIRDKTPLTAMLLDIDHFKNFNDTYGHLAGDDCLKLVARTIENEMNRVSDMAFRYGGEEFAVLLPNTQIKGAVIVAEKIRQRIETTNFKFNGHSVFITISIGLVSRIPERNSSEDEFLSYADDALYKAKLSGRNRVMVHQAESES
jgi:diguanylate cyclase